MTFRPRYIVLHHSATSHTASLEDIKLVHLLRGFDDIGYHWLIYSDGTIRSARPEYIEGAHARGFNAESIGVCLVGNYETSPPSTECLSALTKLLLLLCRVYSISSDNILTHRAVDKAVAAGRITACPGGATISELPELLTKVNSQIVRLPAYQADFRAAFVLEPIFVSKLVVISGRVYNLGRNAWNKNNNEALEDYPFRVGFKVYNELNKLIWEGREIITASIDRGAYFDFISLIPKSNLAVGTNRIELSVVKEGSFWFSEVGDSFYITEINIPELTVTKNAATASMSKYSQRFTDLQLNLVTEKILEISGKLLNSGSMAWDNTSKCVGSYDLVLKIISTGINNSCLHEELLGLPTKIIEPGSKIPFTAQVSLEKLPIGSYIIHLDVVKHSKFWFSELGHATAVLGFLVYPENKEFCDIVEPAIDRTGYEAKLSNFSVSLRHGFVLGLKGALENSGSKFWNNISDLADKPTRLGVKLLSLTRERELAWEGRYELPHRYIQPQEVIPIAIDFNLFGLPAGSYEVLVDVVKERCFWFSDDAAALYQTTITLAERVATRSLSSGINYKPKTSPSNVKILVVSPTLPLFDRETGGKRLLAILRLLKEQGFEVEFSYEEPGPVIDTDRYINAVEELGIKASTNPTGIIADLSPNSIDIALLCWHACATRHIDLIKVSQPQAKVIVDTVDLHWVREARGVAAGELAFSDVELQVRKLAEREVYRKADVVWVVTESDRQALHSEIPDCRSVLVSNMSEKFTSFCDNPSGAGLLFLGGFNHPPNEQAALRAYQAIEQYRKKSGKDVKYYIVGSNPTAAIQALHDGELNIVCGYSKDLDSYYKACRALIAPITYGAGIKGKVCDAICAGIAVITSTLGNEGLDLIDREEVFLAENTEEYASAIADVFSDRFDLKAINSKALKKVLQLTGYEAAKKPITYSIIVPPVTIAIVSYNKRNLLDKLLDSLFALTTYPDLVVSVWLNSCSDGSLELAQEFLRLYPEKFEFHYNQENEFFVRPNNEIIKKHVGRDIVLVNNDIEIISKDWLLELQQAAYTSDLVGAAGGKILDEQRKISEAGAVIFETGLGENVGRGANEESKEFDLVRYVGFVSGCLLYMRRDMIETYGILDDDFHPMYFEDCEWQYRLHRYGVRTIYTPKAKVIHREGSSAGTDTAQGMKRYQEINRKKFLAKFSDQDLMALNNI